MIYIFQYQNKYIDCSQFWLYSSFMISDADVKKLSKVFATKDDLKQLVTTNEFKKGIQSIKKDIRALMIVTDEVAKKHSRRLQNLETHLNLRRPLD